MTGSTFSRFGGRSDHDGHVVWLDERTMSQERWEADCPTVAERGRDNGAGKRHHKFKVETG